MGIDYNYKKLLDGNWKLKGHTIIYDNKIIGLLNPSILLGGDDKNDLFVIGKNGLAKSEDNLPNSLWSAIVGAGGVLLGNVDEVNKVNLLLENDSSSRTVSYLCNIADNCFELLRLVDKIHNANILVLGTGGIGSLTSVLLAGAGIKKMTIVDGDNIEKSNLNRQLFFTRADVGKSKVDVLKKAIQDRFEDVDVVAIAKKVNVKEIPSLVKRFDLTLSTLDEPASLAKEIARIREKEDLNILQAGYFFLTSKIYYNVKFPNNLATGIKFFRGENSIVPSYGPVNSELAGLTSNLIIQILCEKVKGGLYMQFQSDIFPRKTITL